MWMSEEREPQALGWQEQIAKEESAWRAPGGAGRSLLPQQGR